MNSNNWLSFPLSPTHHDSNNFSLGLVNETPFQNQEYQVEWNLMNNQESNQVPKVADFLGVDNDKADGDQDYLYSTNMVSSEQQLTLSMGGTSEKAPPDQTTTTSTAIVEVAAAAAPRRALDTFGQRTSIYRGVTRHRWTGRYEAHLWDNSCRREGQSRKGRQVYLGGYDKEEKAARAYDMAALKYWGASTTTNFPINNYEKELEDMKNMTRQEFVASIRRKSSGFSRGASMYRGVTRHHQHGRWQARIGRVAGNKDLYLGTFSTEEEAAEAYDIAAIKFRGLSAVTNFDMNRYDVKSILESNSLPIGGGAAKRLKEAQAIESSRKREETLMSLASTSSFQMYPLQQQQQQNYFDTQPILSLQNQEFCYQETPSHYNQQAYMQQQQQPCYSYGNYLHGLMNMGMGSSSSSTAMDSSPGMGLGSTEELSFVKLDYDQMSSTPTYTEWSGETVQQEPNADVFSSFGNIR